MSDLVLTGLEGKVAVVTGAGRMRSIGRPIAVELARAGCDVVLTGTGRPLDQYPDDEKEAGWRDIDAVADEVRALGRSALPVVSDVSDAAAVDAPQRQRWQHRQCCSWSGSGTRRRSRPRCGVPLDRRQPPRRLVHELLVC